MAGPTDVQLSEAGDEMPSGGGASAGGAGGARGAGAVGRSLRRVDVGPIRLPIMTTEQHRK